MTTTISGTNGIDKVAPGAVERDDLPAGTVLQVVNATSVAQLSTSSTSFAATALTATITPTSSTSKIIIEASGTLYGQIYATIYKNSTTDLNSANTNGICYVSTAAGNAFTSNCIVYAVDSPATTSATTYTVYVKVPSGTGWWNINTELCTITLMEIAA